MSISTRSLKISLLISPAMLLLIALMALPALKAAGSLPNGVAAGDVTPISAVLWARATTAGNVTFEYATDPGLAGALTEIVTVTDPLQPARVQITGLNPATTYYYRVTDAAAASGEGHFRTPALPGTQAGLRFGVSGDWEPYLAPYPSISNTVERDLDFFVELGDTISPGSATSLSDYRLIHTGVYSTHHGLNTWAALRSSTALLASIDDNDVRNDFAGGADAASDIRFPETTGLINDTSIYENALQVFHEYNALRDEFYGATGDSVTANERKLYRSNRYGSEVAVFVLDSRSFRDQQLEALTDPTDTTAGLAFLTESLSDTTRTLLGAQQLADLKVDLLQAQADDVTWKFIMIPSPIQNLGPFKAHDRYEGYAAERNKLLQFIDENGIHNVVFIAAGLHGTIVNNLTYQEIPPSLPLTLPMAQIETDAFEVIVGPVAVDPPRGPFGPVIVQLALDYGLITPLEKAIYDSLPRAAKDAAIQAQMDNIVTELGYDEIGLDGSQIEATLLQGGYVAAHTYGWTEFEIGQSTQALTVTTYGIDYYTGAELNANPADVTGRDPAIISQFVVNPNRADAAIGDYIWEDVNGDGGPDGSEPGLAGITVYLDLNDNGTLDTGEPNDTSDANGAYGITGLDAGTYTVRVDSSTLPAGYSLTTGNHPLGVNLADNEDYDNADFGYRNPPSLQISKAALPPGGTAVTPNERITYTLTVHNSGGLATNVVITDAIPAGTVYASPAPAASFGAATFDGAQVIVNVPAFSASTTLTATFQVTVTGEFTPTIANIAAVASDQSDLQESNLISHQVQVEQTGPLQPAAYLPLLLKNIN